VTDWGVTQFGFRRKTYADIIAEMESKAKNLLGVNIDLSSASPLALFLRVVAFGLSLLWAVAEKVYCSGFVDLAVGQSLDYAVKYAGISRRAATAAKRMLKVTGDPGTVIPEGFLVGAEDQTIRFATIEAVTIPESGEIEVLAQAVTPGTASNVAAGLLTRIINPIAGVGSATNIDHDDNENGVDRETDWELRERYYLGLSGGGASTLDSIRAAVLSVPGVRAALVRHNTSMGAVDGMPPKSVGVVVLGGVDEDIAKAIHRTIAAGIEPYGDVEVPVEDVGGEMQLIRFSRAQPVTIYVVANIQTTAAFPADGEAQIKDAIIRYIGGVDSHGEVHMGLGLREDVVWTAVIAAVRSVPGVWDAEVLIGIDLDDLGSENVQVGPTGVAEIGPEYIMITRV